MARAFKAAERVQLGRTGLSVTRLGLGTAPLAGLYRPVAEDDALAALEAAWELGLRFFDTAPLYGYGLGETRTGKALRDKPRRDFTLATKVGRLLREGAPPEPGQVFYGTPPVNPVFDFSYDAVMRSIEESRGRLGIERLDVLHIHDPDDFHDEALTGAYRALDELRSAGVIGAVGAGMNQAEMLTRFAREADFDCFLLAGRYTLLDQVALDELLPACIERGVSIIAAGVYNSGILGDPKPGAHYNYKDAPAELMQRAQRIRAVCERHQVPLRAAAVQFPLGHPAVQTVVVGCRSVEQVQDSVRMFETLIPDALWEELKAERLLPDEAPTP
ncbi:MAG TPA: aldo/keto reductase [Candidatus Dormibacteraeota bacterium]|nr:aldo/keto reductase [Candidatus Dormibacteraeota bacterium]